MKLLKDQGRVAGDSAEEPREVAITESSATGRCPSVLSVSPIADVGGAEVLLLDVLRGLKEKGCDVTLLVLGQGDLTDLAEGLGLVVRSGPALSFRDTRSVIRSIRFIRSIVRRTRPDIVHASHPRAGLLTQAALIGVSVAHTIQLLEPPSRRDLVGRLSLRMPGTHIAFTPDMADAHRVQNRRLAPIVIEPGVDRVQQRSRAGLGESMISELRAFRNASDGPGIVMVARLQPFKGPMDFVVMAERVLTIHPNARFLIVGPDSSRSPGLRSSLAQEIERRRLSGRVVLAGALSSVDLAATVQQATLLVHPAHREGFGLVLVEALTLGTPVVAYAASGPSHILEKGGGALVSIGDTGALADAVLVALDDPATLETWRQQAALVAEQFSWDRMISGYLATFRSAAGKVRPQPQ